jgi:alpha-ketoglutarate-dependent taurine dioxygenase
VLNYSMRFPSRRGAIYPRISTVFCWKRSVPSYGSRLGGFTHLNACGGQFDRCLRLTNLSRPKSTLTSQHYDIKSTPISHQAMNNEIEDGENKLDLNGLGNDYSIDIEDNGKVIFITTACKNIDRVVDDNDITDASAITSSSWKFSSALLWVNDPQYLHASSGQRVRTLGQYSRNFAIESAQVIFINGDDEESIENSKIEAGINNSSLRNLHPVPPQGSLHSRGGIYCNTIDNHCTSLRNHGRTLVKLKWNYGQESIFDLDWLIDNASNNCLGRWMPKNRSDLTNGIYSDSGGGDIVHGSSRKKLVGRTTTMTEVTKEIAIGAIDNPNAASIARFDYREILENEDNLFEGMQEIFEHGAILVQNAPYVENAKPFDEESSTTSLESIVGDLGRRLSGGNLSHGSLYGDIFHVQSKVDAQNIAYTNVALPPHQDLTYYESKPFLQLLHCVTNSGDNTDDGDSSSFESGNPDNPTNINRIVGGESTLIDGMAAAEELRRVAPDLFDVLCMTEATFLKERYDADMVSPKPHIAVDPAYGQVVEVNWSPPFEGPLQIHPRVAVEDYVGAYQAIECMLNDHVAGSSSYISDGCNSTVLPESLETLLREYAKEYTWEYALQKGDILVFNNQRMLHGRRSFGSFGDAKRHLIGCYTDAMDTVSRYRQLLRVKKGKYGGGYGKRNPGSGCRWM